MRCPHCSISINLTTKTTEIMDVPEKVEPDFGCQIFYGTCPACGKVIAILKWGVIASRAGYDNDADTTYLEIAEVMKEEIIYPHRMTRWVEVDVPDSYRQDFSEAQNVLNVSSKASAALSRRILQSILREEFKIKAGTLAEEIEVFITRKDVPSYLTQAIDAVRNIGNFAAHPLKDNCTGMIVDVELGEAEWLLEVIESLFDFTFIQPQKLEERKNRLNQKLKALGKRPMKEK